ncbi:MAG: DUF6152 family protein [Acidobacteria bacterium]|nr:DUF6152 family protein [Acidobacteriota bacterium]
MVQEDGRSRTRWLGILMAAGLCLLGTPLVAHHAIGQFYDEERTVVLEGEVVAFRFGEPHSMVQLRVRNGQDDVHTWALEWRGASHLQQHGWTDRALSPGDPVRICGNPGRDPGAYRVYLLNLEHTPSGRPTTADAGEGLCALTLRGPNATSTASR